MIIQDRGRYSRWAIAAGAAAAIALGDFVFFTTAPGGLARSAVAPGIATPFNFGTAINSALSFGIVVAMIATGPACVVLGKIAQRDLRRHPHLRGKTLADLVAMFGWLTCSIEIAFGLLLCVLHFTGALYV
jgi:hypothetical protein